MPAPYIPPTTPVNPAPMEYVDVNQTNEQKLKQYQDQQQKQNQRQNQVVNNNPSESSNSNNLKNDVRSAPEAEINQSQSSSLNNYQINSQAESAWVKFSNATAVPVPQFYVNGNYNRSEWSNFGDSDSNVNVNVGVTIPLAGSAKKLAYQEVEVNTTARVLSICNSLGYFDGKIDIDFGVRKELSQCQGVKRIPQQTLPVPVPPTTPRMDKIKELRMKLQESIQRREQMEKKIDLLIQNRIPVEVNTNVPVGG